MKVERSKALTKRLAGETFHFCSEHCLHAFEADPHHYHRDLAQPPDGSGSGSTRSTNAPAGRAWISDRRSRR
jgi:YHS domain-containing protein